MSSGKSCSKCGSSDLESDPSRGDVYCTKCGQVVESGLIVSEVQFEEGSRGGSHIVGQHVGDTGSSRVKMAGSMFGYGKESRQVTLDAARAKITAFGSNLKLNKYCIDVAFNFYKRALQRHLTHGRKISHVIAACIYITCRIEGTPHILLDLSDVTQVNVYNLGRTYLKLSSALHISLPAVDPCVYIDRYASQLNLGDKLHEISITAMRIVQRMKKDWIHFGRRPSGLCGAAILVAARLHDKNCGVKDLIPVVKVCEATIRKRLFEFSDTPTSKLTLDEFMSVDLEGEEDPPCFKAARKKLKMMEDEGKMDEIEKDVSNLSVKIEQELDKLQSNRKYKSFLTSSVADGDDPESDVITQLQMDELNQVVSHCITSSENDDDSTGPKTTVSDSPFLPNATSLGLNETFGLEPQPYMTEDSENGVKNRDENSFVPHDTSNNGELFTEDLDEDEMDSYILSSAEVSRRTILWEKMNADWIQEMEEKRRESLEKEKNDPKGGDEDNKSNLNSGGPNAKKKRRNKKRQPIVANTAGEAIEKMLQEKRISNKINYEVLKSLSAPFMTPDVRSPNIQQSIPSPDAKIDETSNDSLMFKKPASPIKRGSGNFLATHTLSTISTPHPVISSQMNTSSPAKRLPSIRNFVSTHTRLPKKTRVPIRKTPVDTTPTITSGSSQDSGISEFESSDATLTPVKRRLSEDTNDSIQKDEPPSKFMAVEDSENDDEDLDDDEPQVSMADLLKRRTGGTTDDLMDNDSEYDYD